MKYGLLTYTSYGNYFNIGDYIQSLAAKQFLPRIDVLLNREHLNELEEEDSVKVILNGWFLHEPKNWPPHSSIQPLFISFHLNSDAYSILENQTTIQYFKNFEPIGCRDYQTVKILKEKGINAYFSGCLTLSLGKDYASDQKRDKVYIIDPHFDIRKSLFYLFKYSRTLIFNFKKIKAISLKKFQSNKLKNLIKTSAFYSEYSKILDDEVLISAEYITQILDQRCFINEDEKFEYASNLLSKFSTASLVITSRIHCALPCLALETPVVYINDLNKSQSSACRLDGLIQLFNSIDYNCGEFASTDINLNFKLSIHNILTNKKAYKLLLNNLLSICSDFTNK